MAELKASGFGEAVVASIPEIVDRLIARIPPEDPPGYGSVNLDDARRLAEEAMEVYARCALVEQRLPRHEDLDWMHEMVRARVTLGVPLSSLVGSIPTTFGEIWNECARIAEKLGIGASSLTEAGSLLWGWAAAFAREATRVYQEIEVSTIRADERRRAELVRSLLADSISPAASVELAAYGLIRGTKYHALRAKAATESDTIRLERSLGATTEREGGLLGVVGDDLAGVIRTLPAIGQIDAVVAIGPAADLGALSGSFEIATRILASSARLGLSGVLQAEDLGLALAVAADDVVGDRLVSKYLEPLDHEGEFGSVVAESVRTFIDSNMQIDEAARRLVIHPNTLRYRLRRFEELTSVDTKSSTQMFEVWWALRRRAHDLGSTNKSPEGLDPQP